MMESELRGIFCARGGKYIYIQSFCWETLTGNYFRNPRIKMKDNIKVSLLALEHTDVG
jgi:hypothetical protein